MTAMPPLSQAALLAAVFAWPSGIAIALYGFRRGPLILRSSGEPAPRAGLLCKEEFLYILYGVHGALSRRTMQAGGSAARV